MAIMGSEGGRWEAAKNRSAKVLKGKSSSGVVGGGLVVGIVTIIAVGVAGKLLSKFRRPSGSTNSTATPFITPANSLDKIVNGENSDLPIHLEGETQPSNEAVINGESLADGAAISLDLENGGLDHNDTSTTITDGEEHPDPISSDLHTDSSVRNIVDKTSFADLQSGSAFTQDSQDGDESRDELSTTSAALSEFVNHALADAKDIDDSPSVHELLSKTKALQDGMKGVISRAIEDFSSCGDTSSDELTPRKLKLTVSWEANSSSGSEEEAAQVHPGELIADKELPLPGSTETEAGEETIESVNHDAPTGQPEEEVFDRALHSSSVPFEEKADERKGATTGENDIEGAEQLLQEDETVTLGDSKPANPKEVVPEIEQEKIEPHGSLASLPMKKEINEVTCFLDDTTTLSLTAKGVSSEDEEFKKENLSQECAKSRTGASIFKLNADTEAEIFKLTSILLGSTHTSSDEITEVVEDVNSVQISTEIANEKEVTPLTVKSSLVLPATSHYESTLRKIVEAKESGGAAGIESKKTTVVTTTVEFTSNTGGGLKRELANRRGTRSPLEVLTLVIIVALIAALVWSFRTGSSLVRG